MLSSTQGTKPNALGTYASGHPPAQQIAGEHGVERPQSFHVQRTSISLRKADPRGHRPRRQDCFSPENCRSLLQVLIPCSRGVNGPLFMRKGDEEGGDMVEEETTTADGSRMSERYLCTIDLSLLKRQVDTRKQTE